jgi:hypothetical protein
MNKSTFPTRIGKLLHIVGTATQKDGDTVTVFHGYLYVELVEIWR